MTATILTSFRNVGLTFGLVGEFAGPELAVYVGVCQIPMFLCPLLFDLFVGSRNASNRIDIEEPDPESDEVELQPEPQSPIQPAGLNALQSGGNSRALAASGGQSYFVSGNTALATDPSSVVCAALAEPSKQPFEAALLQHGLVKQPDAEEENTRALMQRLEDALSEATEGVRRYKEEDENRSAARYLGVFAVLCVLGLAGCLASKQAFFANAVRQ